MAGYVGCLLRSFAFITGANRQEGHAIIRAAFVSRSQLLVPISRGGKMTEEEVRRPRLARESGRKCREKT